MKRVTFKNGTIDIAANIHLPDNFDSQGKYAALVCVHPGSSVKEQTAGIYARKMADAGYVAIVFDASFQGASGGEPRYLESPTARVEDIRCAVDYLTTLSYVDGDRIGVLGICAGGGYAVNAAMTEHRIKAVGTVVANNIGRAYRENDPIGMLEAVGKQRTLEAGGGRPLIVNWLPDTPDDREKAGMTGLDITEAVDYYRTPRAQHENASNKLLYASAAGILGFDAFHLVDVLLTQPIQIIVGNRVGEFGSYKDGIELYEKAKSPKDLFVVDGASHYDLYDRLEYVDQAVEKLRGFYAKYLSA